jgi:2',3'-cyclic-nucleotide 2'-phosphodiesterase/3'-nucleotidase
LQTTDLHMHLLGCDYFVDQRDDRLGLASLVDTIEELGTENTDATLLFDNGDFLQGNPLADTLATTSNAEETHTMIAAMNCLRYDAITLGNQEFDYGVPFLCRALGRLRAHVVSANIRCFDEPALASSFRILARDLRVMTE